MRVLVIFSIFTVMFFSGLIITEAYGSVVEINFDDMVQQSELIIIGNVTDIVPTFETFGSPKDQFFHDVTLDIDMTLFKDVSFTEVSFRIQKDRPLDGFASDISTSQDFETGDRVLVFLTKSIDNDYWDGQYHVLGNHQGKYSIINGQAFGSHFDNMSEKDLVSKIYETKLKNKIPKHSLDSSFTLSYNQTALVEDQLYVTFSRVTEDSRCPTDVTCVWQGKTAIQLDLRSGKYHTQKILSVGGDSNPSDIVFDTYKIKLQSITPNPLSTKTISKSDYSATLQISKSGFIPTPLKQIQDGVSPVMIQCDGLVLIHKYDGKPACVKLDTKTKLIERGWTHNQNDKPIEKQIKITEKTALQVCNIMDISCPSDPTFDALQNLYTKEITMNYSVGLHEYSFTITSSKICYTVDGLKDRYCESRKTEKPKGLDGNKPTLLSKSATEWKNMSEEELYKYYEKHSDHFWKELGKFLVKHEMKQELQKNNITNIHDDFTIYSGIMLTSNPPRIGFQAVINGTDGNSYLLSGGSHANTASVSGLEKLVFYDTIKKHSTEPFYENLQTITIYPENETNSKVEPYSVVIYLDKNNSVIFYNTLPESIRIQEDTANPAWTTPLIMPNQTFTLSFDKTGYYKWDARFPPAPFDDWWKPHAGGEIAVISDQTQNLEFGDKLEIAGTIIKTSEIPWSSMGTGNNEGLRIGLSHAIVEMLPDAKEYYTARADQLIPFDVPIIIQD